MPLAIYSTDAYRVKLRRRHLFAKLPTASHGSLLFKSKKSKQKEWLKLLSYVSSGADFHFPVPGDCSLLSHFVGNGSCYKALKRRKTTRNVKKKERGSTAAAQAFCSDNSDAPRTAESSAVVAEMVRSTDRKRLIKEDIPARRPFTDITNQDRTVKRKRRETRDKSRTKNTRIENAELKEYSRNLFEEEFIHGGITTGIVYDENCEETRFQECGDTLFDSDNSNDDYVDPISEDSSSGESDIGL
uniref:Uncharacterized protein n=1 Tax=Daucus carota subsp. sativus TaxID=79200 RepID=A0A175YFF9_DAUCS